jgi:uncharacterized protein (TIGR03435 family)
MQAQNSSSHGAEAPVLRVTKWLQAPAGFDAQWSRLRGKVVVLDFWATWCAPCVRSIPHLNQLANEFRGQDVVFLAVTDDDEERLKAFLPKHPIDAIIGIDTEDRSFKAFALNYFGTTVLVGKDGNIIGTTDTENLTADVLKDALAGKSPALPQTQSNQSDVDWDKNSIEWQDGIVPLMYAIIKPIKPNGGAERAGSDRITADGVGLLELVELAYKTDPFHVDWQMPRDNQAYRAAFRVPEGRKEYLLPYMQQTLADFFGIEARWEDRERDVYILRHMQRYPVLPESRSEKEQVLAWHGKITLRRQPVSALCKILANIVLDAIVVDEVGMTGNYDFDLSYQHGNPELTTQGLRELGFEVVKERRNVPILVVTPERAPKT